MDKQTLYIILIIGIFNFLLINIFRLQKDISIIRGKGKEITGFTGEKVKYNADGNGNNGTGLDGVKEIMNDISELVPIDFNKKVDSKEKFTPKYEQF